MLIGIPAGLALLLIIIGLWSLDTRPVPKNNRSSAAASRYPLV